MTDTKKKTTSIRIKLEGKRTPAELRLMLNEAVDKLQDQGIKQFKNCNLYVTPLYDNGQTDKFDTFTITRPYRCAADEHGV